MTDRPLQGRWALILGASSGFGAATGKALAAAGMNIAGVHLDLRSTLPQAKAVIAEIEAQGVTARFFTRTRPIPTGGPGCWTNWRPRWDRARRCTSSCTRSRSAR